MIDGHYIAVRVFARLKARYPGTSCTYPAHRFCNAIGSNKHPPRPTVHKRPGEK